MFGQSNKKSPRSHISISYEDEKTEKEILDKKSCELCECDPASSGEKVKTKYVQQSWCFENSAEP